MTEKSSYILKGDINGIQNFIYNVYQGQGGVAKILRARSFLISIIPHVILKFLKDSLKEKFPGKFSISPDPDAKDLHEKLLINEGGGFTANIRTEIPKKDFTEFIEKFKLEAEKFFIQQFHGELGLSLALAEVEEYDNFSTVYALLECSKKRKFSSYLISIDEELPILDRSGSKTLCPVCRTFFYTKSEDSEGMCDFCQHMKKIGEKLPKFEDFYIDNNEDFLNKDRTNKSKTCKVYDFKIGDKNYSLVFTSQEKEKKLKLVTVPIISKNLQKTLSKEEIQKIKQELDIDEPIPGAIAPFELIAKASKGDSKIGYLTIDVDNLGLLFQASKDREVRKFFSKCLNEFFSFKVPEIALNKFQPGEIEIGNRKIKVLEETTIYILYSGGDDLFAIGPWDKIINFAITVNKEFSEFKESILSNKKLKPISKLISELTLSAGLVLTKPKFTVRIAAEWCRDAEDKSKSSGKNSITLFGETLKWEDFKSTIDEAESWVKLINESEKEIPRRFIYRFYKLYLDLIYYPKKFEERKRLEFYPRIYYLIARTIPKEHRSKAVSLVEKTLNEENFGVKTFCNYVLTATRGK